MIAQLKGNVISAENGTIVLDIGGVGFAIHTPVNVDVRVGTTTVFQTYLHVRENELTLYGFADTDDKMLFEMLLGVSGVGPKAALSVMSTLSSDTLRRAILNQQPEVLARAPGVGKKTAGAIILHLKDKIKRQPGPHVEMAADDADVIAALTALGFSLVEAQRALQQLPRDATLTLDEKIRRSLVMLGK